MSWGIVLERCTTGRATPVRPLTATSWRVAPSPGRRRTSGTPGSSPPCSANEIARYVGRLLNAGYGRQCLDTALPQFNVPNVQGVMPGQLYTADQQCQHIYGPQSRYCHGGNFGNLDGICTSMFCLVPGNRRRIFCVEYHAAHGTTCANGKWCEEGACVANANAPNIPQGNCPFGDQLTLVNRRRCPQAVAARPALCYNQRVRTICCATCAQNAQANSNANRAACPFGDRVRRCNQQSCHRLLPDGTPYARDCCGTCNFDATQWTCADAPNGVDGAPCRAAVQADQVQGCYNSTLAFSCCASCQEQRTPQGREGCEYGDRDLTPEFCQRLSNSSQPCTQQQRDQCCRTCGAKENDNQGIIQRSSAISTLTLQWPIQLCLWLIAVCNICRLWTCV
ncbi:A disintegrin and metalloproteinase with thrombospondin motifs 6-like isoform X1 [Littorina saxatilis]|uniref:A disintegrin and metalloproteinase with thrombospondin motifs 6-like isoform X1 n=1 Tax=Littorina saxatilis TaxID=31220 RepID=UPI0038B46C1E